MKKWTSYIVVAVVAAITICSLGCRKKDDTSFDKGAMLTHYADNYILPAYTDALVKLNAMQTKIDEFTADPDTISLKALRTSWKEAYICWQSVDMLEFGSATGLRSFINTYPTSVTKINSNIATGDYDLEQATNKDAQGFPALDYLMNGIAMYDTSIIKYYTTHTNAAGHKQYLKAVTEKMLSRLTTVLDVWNTYRNTFIQDVGSDSGGSISRMVNGYVNYYERYLCTAKLGLPSGAISGGAARPDLTEAYYMPSVSTELAKAALNSTINFYEGLSYGTNTNNNLGLRHYLITTGKATTSGRSVADVISLQFEDAKADLDEIKLPIQDLVAIHRQPVIDAYNSLNSIVPNLKVDMASAFGITIR